MAKMCFDLNNFKNYEHKPFIFERKSNKKENIYSYGSILKETIKCIKYLQKFQVEKHAGIAINLKEHSAETCILILGILNHECSFYCLDFDETKDVNVYLKLSGVKYIISRQNLKINEQCKNELKILNDVFYLHLLKIESSIFENVRLCYTIATSGSTGFPKIVHVPYECIQPNINTLSLLLNIQENDLIFLGSPPTFDPFVVELFISLQNGASILITSKEIRLNPQKLLHIMFPEVDTLKQGVTVYQTTPSIFRLFGQQNIQDVILNKNSSLRCLLLGGEDFPSSLELTSWLPLDFILTGKRIFNIYGITEISCWSSIYEINTKSETFLNDRVPLGESLDEFTCLRLVDKFGNVLLHNNAKGELEIGSSVRCCFIPQYDTDIKILESNNIIYRKTGDLVERDHIGNIYYIGRTNNTIKRLGKRLNLDTLNKKIENLLNENNLFYKVISLWEQEMSSLIFYLVKSKLIMENEKEFIKNMLKENLENYEQPDKIFYNNKIPLNLHGKVDNRKILQHILLPANSPLEIFKDFLINVMNIPLEKDRDVSKELLTSNKRLKMSTNLSFTKAGGTSFQALSLATEIAEYIESIEQHKILEMLLDDKTSIEDTLKFLKTCSMKYEIEKHSYDCLENINSTGYKLKLLWRCDLKKCIDAAPTIYEDKYVAVGSHSHMLLTVNSTTGEKISCLKLNNRIECPVVFVSSQLALVGCYDGFLYGFNFQSGYITWKLDVKGMIKAKPLIIQNIIIIASYADDFNIVAYDLKSLGLMWRLKLGSKGIFSSPLQITKNSVLFCTLDGTYAVVEIDTGCIKWRHKLDTPIFSTSAIIQTSNEIFLILAEVSGKISVCAVENGETISCFQTDGNIFSGLTLYRPCHTTNHTLIIFGCHDKNVYCLKIAHKNKQLRLFSKFSLNSPVYSTPIVVLNRYILACSTKGLLVLLSINNFNVLASYDLKADVFSSPSCLRDTFYLGSRDNYLYALQLEK